jgi:hypothetical protein
MDMEQLVASAQICSAVFGSCEHDLVLVELPVPLCLNQGLAAQGLRLLGLIGFLPDGAVHSVRAEELSDASITSLLPVFARQVDRALARAGLERAAQPAPPDDFVAFMDALIALPDNRT